MNEEFPHSLDEGLTSEKNLTDLHAGHRESEVLDINRRTLWFGIVLPLCGYGFFLSFKASEPFLTVFLATYKHLTLLQVRRENPRYAINGKQFVDFRMMLQISNQVYPIYTYALLVSLPLVAFFTDALGYKLIISMEAMGELVTYAILTWASVSQTQRGRMIDDIVHVVCLGSTLYASHANNFRAGRGDASELSCLCVLSCP
jgi:hypothetical protein